MYHLKLEMYLSKKAMEDLLFTHQGSIRTYEARQAEPDLHVTNPGEPFPVVEPVPVRPPVRVGQACPGCGHGMTSAVCQQCGYGSDCYAANTCETSVDCPFYVTCVKRPGRTS